MGRQIVSLIIFFILIVILVGAGILLYRFLVSYNSSKVAVLTINDQSKFTAYQLNLENDKPYRVKNDDDQKQVIKKQSDNTTVVEVEPKSTSRELSTTDDSRTKLYISSNPNQVATIITGKPESDSSSSTTTNTSTTNNTNSNTSSTTNNTSSNQTSNNSGSGSVESANTSSSQPLPNTGPENYLVAPLLALFGYGLYRFSSKLLKN